VRSGAVLAAALVLLHLPSVAAQERRGAAPGDFDLYVLALSWSPGFCATGGDSRDAEQCAAGNGLGLVVHGLWPQYERGYPSFCRTPRRRPQQRDLGAARALFPSADLAAYQWRKHGSCTGLTPGDYFRAVVAARSRLALPPELAGTGHGEALPPLALERRLAAANPGLRPDMIAIDCGRSEGGAVVLQEVRVCLTRDLRSFRPCPADVEQRSCRAPSVTVNAAE
jgi:ribonuclease T2